MKNFKYFSEYIICRPIIGMCEYDTETFFVCQDIWRGGSWRRRNSSFARGAGNPRYVTAKSRRTKHGSITIVIVNQL